MPAFGRTVLTALVIAAVGTAPAAAQAPFADHTAASGVSAAHHALDLQIGQAWGDVDRDGCPDLYLTDSGGANTLWRNRCDGSFELSPLSAQLALAGVPSSGAAFADYDNDGWLDLFVAAWGVPGSLFRNLGGAGFADVTAAAGLTDDGQGTSIAWGDYDGDGWLDLYVVNYDDVGSPLSRDDLYRNRGDGTFEDVGGLLAASGRERPGYAVRWLDYDLDGDSDLYVINDKQVGNVLWRNDGPGCGGWCFTDVSLATGADRPVCGMGIAAGDYDLDGDLDLYFSSSREMVLLENRAAQGDPSFVEVSQAAGVSLDAIGWGAEFLDYDLDGWPDLYLATMNPDPAASNRLFRNRGDGTFEDVSAGCGADDAGPTLGVAASDYDRDGLPDLVIGNLGQGYRLYRNGGAAAAGHGWLGVELEGRGPVNRDALGTRVAVVLDDGRTLLQDVKSGTSYGAGNDLALHFGLGTAAIVRVEVAWPDGNVESVAGVAPNGTWRHRYPALFEDGFESGDLAAWSAAAP